MIANNSGSSFVSYYHLSTYVQFMDTIEPCPTIRNVEVKEIPRDIIATKSCTKASSSGNDITVLCQQFVDRIFVSVSQKGKVGYLVSIDYLTISYKLTYNCLLHKRIQTNIILIRQTKHANLP